MQRSTAQSRKKTHRTNEPTKSIHINNKFHSIRRKMVYGLLFQIKKAQNPASCFCSLTRQHYASPSNSGKRQCQPGKHAQMQPPNMAFKGVDQHPPFPLARSTYCWSNSWYSKRMNESNFDASPNGEPRDATTYLVIRGVF